MIDPAAARDFERPLKPNMKSENQVENITSNPKSGSNPSASSDYGNNPFGNKPPSDDMPNP